MSISRLFANLDGWMDGLMTNGFMAISKVFQSFSAYGRVVIMKSFVQWSPVNGGTEDFNLGC